MGSRYGLIILLGLIPLAVLAALSLVDLFGYNSDRASDTALPSTEGVDELVANSTAAAESNEQYVRSLCQLTAAPYDEGDPISANGACDHVKPTVAKWQIFESARRLVVRSSGALVSHDDPPDVIIPVESLTSINEVQELTSFYEKEVKYREEWLNTARPYRDRLNVLKHDIVTADSQGIRGTGEVSGIVTKREPELAQQIGTVSSTRDELESSRNKLDDLWMRYGVARDRFSRRQFDSAMQKFANYQGPVPPEVATLKLRAEFWRDSTNLNQRAIRILNEAVVSSAISTWESLKLEMEGFTTRFETLPDPAERDKDSRQRNQVRRNLASLTALLGGEDIRHLDVIAWIPLARQNLAINHVSRHVMTKYQNTLKQKLEHNLPQKETPNELKGVQEAVFRNNASLLGVFRLEGGGKFYDWWRSPEEFKQNPNFPTDSFRADSFSLAPQTPAPIECVVIYENTRKQLLNNLCSRRHWENFCTACEPLQNKLQVYLDRGQITSVSFSSEVDFATRVLRLWEDIEYLSRDTSAE